MISPVLEPAQSNKPHTEAPECAFQQIGATLGKPWCTDKSKAQESSHPRHAHIGAGASLPPLGQDPRHPHEYPAGHQIEDGIAPPNHENRIAQGLEKGLEQKVEAAGRPPSGEPGGFKAAPGALQQAAPLTQDHKHVIQAARPLGAQQKQTHDQGSESG